MAIVEKKTAVELTDMLSVYAAELFADHGFDAPKTKTKYGDFYQITIVSTPLDQDDSGVNRNSLEAQAFLRAAEAGSIPLPPEALGFEFSNHEGFRYQLTGYAPRRSKFPYLARRLHDGKTFKFAWTMENDLRKQWEATR